MFARPAPSGDRVIQFDLSWSGLAQRENLIRGLRACWPGSASFGSRVQIAEEVSADLISYIHHRAPSGPNKKKALHVV